MVLREGSEGHRALLHSAPVVGVLLCGLGREQVVVGGVEEGLAIQWREDVRGLDLHKEEVEQWAQSRFLFRENSYVGALRLSLIHI